jgi:hypothetical protein
MRQVLVRLRHLYGVYDECACGDDVGGCDAIANAWNDDVYGECDVSYILWGE